METIIAIIAFIVAFEFAKAWWDRRWWANYWQSEAKKWEEKYFQSQDAFRNLAQQMPRRNQDEDDADWWKNGGRKPD